LKRILVIIPFRDIYPPMNGGKQRAINLLHQLAKHFEVTAIIQQDIASFSCSVEEYPALKNCTILSTESIGKPRDLFSLLPSRLANALRFRYWNRSLKGPAEESFLLIYPVLNDLLKKKKFDHVILEEMGSLNTTRTIRRFLPAMHIIYDAYNVNTKLAVAETDNGMKNGSHLELIRQMESNLYKSVDAIFTCSDQDLEELIRMNGNRIEGVVIPNGVTIPAGISGSVQEAGAGTDDVLFCGSLDYFPNQEGLIWFCQHVFPLLLAKKPSVRLLVVGKGDPGDELRNFLNHPSIINYGRVDRVDVYYKKAALALIPLLSGSGTRLKLLEAMGKGVAVISTSVGAEGIDYTDKKNILIADDPVAFSQAILRSLEDKQASAGLAAEAFLLVKKEYDWEVIGNKLVSYLTT
jgi:polysaccharide biosynthesis protein PslH